LKWFRGMFQPVKAAWDKVTGAIHSAATWTLDFLRKHWPLILAILTGPIQDARDAIGHIFGRGGPVRTAFSNAVDGIKTIWSNLKEAVKGPIRFVVNTVYNKGIVPFVNRIPFIPGTLHTIPG